MCSGQTDQGQFTSGRRGSRSIHERPLRRAAITSAILAPIFAGLSTTDTPAAFRAAILSPAVPLPPDMMAPKVRVDRASDAAHSRGGEGAHLRGPCGGRAAP